MTAPLLRRLLLLAGLLGLAACQNGASGLPPPGTKGGSKAQLFFPTALAVSDDGLHLYVANSNFDLAFNAGTLVEMETAAFNTTVDEANLIFPQTNFSVGTLDSFAGNMLFSTQSKSLFVTTRQRPTLSIAPIFQGPVPPGSNQRPGQLACTSGDCRISAVQLTNFQDPFALARAQLPLPSNPTVPVSVLLVSPMGQLPTNNNGVGFTTAVAVIPEPLGLFTPSPEIKEFNSVSYTVDLGIPGSSSIAVGPGNEISVGGCFVLVAGGSQIPCVGDPDLPQFQRTNILRVFDGDAGPAAQVFQQQLGTLLGTPTTGSAQTRALAVSTVDATHPGPASLYVATTTPNTLLVTTLPVPGTTIPPQALGAIPLASTPGAILVLPRPDAGDLIAATALESNGVLIVDPVLGTVVKQIQPIGSGSGPYGLAAFHEVVQVSDPANPQNPPTPVPLTHVYVSLFNSCAVARIDVPDATPEQAKLVSTVGSCP